MTDKMTSWFCFDTSVYTATHGTDSALSSTSSLAESDCLENRCWRTLWVLWWGISGLSGRSSVMDRGGHQQRFVSFLMYCTNHPSSLSGMNAPHLLLRLIRHIADELVMFFLQTRSHSSCVGEAFFLFVQPGLNGSRSYYQTSFLLTATTVQPRLNEKRTLILMEDALWDRMTWNS